MNKKFYIIDACITSPTEERGAENLANPNKFGTKINLML